MADDLQTLLNAALLRIPVTEPERDQLWDAFASATDPGDLSTRILATLKRRPDDPVLQKATSELQTLAKSSVFQTPGMAPVGAPSSTAVQGVTRPVLEVASALGGESVFNLPARFGFTPSGLDTNEMRRRAQTQDFERSVQAGLWRPTAGASPQLRQAEYEQQARQELLNTGMAFVGGAVPAALDVATNPVELAARASGFGAAVDLTRAARGMRAAQRAADVGDLAAAAEQTARATQAATRAEQFAQTATRVNRGAAGLGVATGAALTAEGLESGDVGQVGQGLAVAGMSGAGAAAQSRYGTMPVQQVARGVGRDVTLRMRDAVRRGQEIVGLRQSPENVVRQSGVFQTLTPTGAASNQVKQADFGTGQAVIAAGMKRLQAEGKLPDLNRYDMTQDYYDISRMAADAGVDQIYDTWAEAGTIAAEHLNEVIRATRQASVLYNKGQMPEAEYRRFVDQANAARAATVVDPRLNRIQGKITGLYGDRPASRAKALQYYNRVRAGKADLPPGVLDSQLPNDTVRYLRDINVERNRFISTRPSDRRVTELTDPEIGVLNAMEAELSDRLIAQLENMGVTEARKMGEAVAITLKMRNRMLENQEKLQSYAEGIPLTTPERVMRTASQGAAGGAAALALGGVTPLGAAGGAGAAFTAGRLFGMAREFVRQGQRTTTRNAEMQKWLRNIQQLQEPARYSTPQAGAPVEAPPFPDIRTWPAPKQITEGEVIDAERIYPGSIDPYAPQPRQIGVTPPPSAVVDVASPQYQRFVRETGRTTTPPQIPQRSSSGMGPQQGPTIDPRTGQPAVVELATPEQYVAQNTPMPRQMRQQLTQEILAQLPANVEIVMTAGPDGKMVGGVGLRSKAGAETAIEPLAAINQGLRQGAVPAPSPDYTIATTRSADGTIRSADVRSTQTNQVARRFVGPDAYRKAEAFVYSKDTRRRNSKLSLEYVDDATLLALARPAAAAPTPPPGAAPATGAIEVTPATNELPQTMPRPEEPVPAGEPPVVSSSAPFAGAPQPSPSPDTAPLGVPETAAAPLPDKPAPPVAKPTPQPQAPAAEAPATAPVDTPAEASEQVRKEVTRIINTEGATTGAEVQRRVIATLQEELARVRSQISAYDMEWSEGTESSQLVVSPKGQDSDKFLLAVDGDGNVIGRNGEYLAVKNREALSLPADTAYSKKKDTRITPAPVDSSRQNIEAAAAQYLAGNSGKVTIQIPGDGTFTINQTPFALEEMIRRVSKAGPQAWRLSPEMKAGTAAPSNLRPAVKAAKGADAPGKRVPFNIALSGENVDKFGALVGEFIEMPQAPNHRFVVLRTPNGWGVYEYSTGLLFVGGGETSKAKAVAKAAKTADSLEDFSGRIDEAIKGKPALNTAFPARREE